MDYCITYFSSAISSTTEEVIVEIVDVSRKKNALLCITGVLLYINGRIVQVLEGPQLAVEALYERIQTDPRHTDVRAVVSQPTAQRLFSDWYMGYETLTSQQYDQVSSIIPIDNQDDLFGETEQPIVVRMLRGFFDLNSRRSINSRHL